MSDPPRVDDRIKEHYADSARLNVRIRLHRQFSTNKLDWYRWVYNLFELPDRCRLLELGCGPGRLWRSNCDRIPAAHEVILSDFSPGMLTEARDNLKHAARRFAYLAVDAQAIPFADEALDAVVANHMLYHVPDLDKTLSEIRRVLKPGGRVYAATNGLDNLMELRDVVRAVAPDLPFADNTLVRPFCLENGAALLEKYFMDVRQERYENSLRVTLVKPLVDYVLSTVGARQLLAGEDVSHLRRIIEDRLESEGAIHILCSTGMFVARRFGP